MRAYIDSDIMIWYLRGEKSAAKFFKKVRKSNEYDLYIGAMQRAEIVFFMRPEEEELTSFFLSQLKTVAVDQDIIDNAGKLYRKYNPSHGTDINDAILAATVLQTGGVVFTLNKKHYPMSNLIVKKAW
jgi:predicted nucleic acid-binding protein